MSNDWVQNMSDVYRRLAHIAVPARAEQIAILLCLIPFDAHDGFHVVELASGEGHLSQAILQAFSKATLLALDFEPSMRESTLKRLDHRGRVGTFDIRKDDWFETLRGADVVISSLCIHHLDEPGKKRLFSAVRSHVSKAFLIADLIEPKVPQANQVFAATWDAMAESACIEQTQSRELFTVFQREHWNLYHHPDPDFDKPSPLFEQLTWLKDVGFAIVDCFWMQAGHAIYGAYRQSCSKGIDYRPALELAKNVLHGEDTR